MEVYVYEDEVDVRLHEGSFLLKTNTNLMKKILKIGRTILREII